MPYMQRITWSGIAIHAGVLPGYPASHGCIRMPMAFAMKMWNWTRMGARVVVTPGEMTPANFSHPLLVTQKVVPQPVRPSRRPMRRLPRNPTRRRRHRLRSRLRFRRQSSNCDRPSATPMAQSRPSANRRHPSSLREQTHTADASGDMPALQPAVAMTDAASSGGNARARAAPNRQRAGERRGRGFGQGRRRIEDGYKARGSRSPNGNIARPSRPRRSPPKPHRPTTTVEPAGMPRPPKSNPRRARPAKPASKLEPAVAAGQPAS